LKIKKLIEKKFVFICFLYFFFLEYILTINKNERVIYITQKNLLWNKVFTLIYLVTLSYYVLHN